MSDIKNTGKFAIVTKVLDDNGTPTGVVRAKITDNIVLTKGQTVFFNDLDEELVALVSKNIISAEDAEERKQSTAKRDREYNQETVYSLRAGKPPEVSTSSKASPAKSASKGRL